MPRIADPRDLEGCVSWLDASDADGGSTPLLAVQIGRGMLQNSFSRPNICLDIFCSIEVGKILEKKALGSHFSRSLSAGIFPKKLDS